MNAFTYAPNAAAANGATDAGEPSMDELLARLAALGDDIRRARQRYGMANSGANGGGQKAGEADEQ